MTDKHKKNQPQTNVSSLGLLDLDKLDQWHLVSTLNKANLLQIADINVECEGRSLGEDTEIVKKTQKKTQKETNKKLKQKAI